MQTWKSVLNGILVVAAGAGLFFYIDFATEPQNQPMDPAQYEAARAPRASSGHRDLLVATPPDEFLTTNSEP